MCVCKGPLSIEALSFATAPGATGRRAIVSRTQKQSSVAAYRSPDFGRSFILTVESLSVSKSRSVGLVGRQRNASPRGL